LTFIGGGGTFQKPGPVGARGWPTDPTTGPVGLVSYLFDIKIRLLSYMFTSSFSLFYLALPFVSIVSSVTCPLEEERKYQNIPTREPPNRPAAAFLTKKERSPTAAFWYRQKNEQEP
jgi:hypothetical protein